MVTEPDLPTLFPSIMLLRPFTPLTDRPCWFRTASICWLANICGVIAFILILFCWDTPEQDS